jgi:hypothetical protein
LENIPTVASPPLETTPRRWAQTLARYREPQTLMLPSLAYNDDNVDMSLVRRVPYDQSCWLSAETI